MPDPLLSAGTRTTPQSQPIPGSGQTRNEAGGYGWEIDDWTRLKRFLILGTESGTFYVGERELTLDNVEVLHRCIAADGVRVVNTVVEVSEAGSAPKQGPTLFAHAACAAIGNRETRKLAYATLERVCRTATMLYQWNGYADTMRGWSRGRRSAVARWYTGKPVPAVAYQGVKYRQRQGWSHRDLLRLAHPKTDDPARKALFDFLSGREVESGMLPLVDAYNEVRTGEASNAEVTLIIRDVGLPWEALPDIYLSTPEIWDALLDSIGLTALLRNLPRLTRIGVVPPMGRLDDRLLRLADPEQLRKDRIHPVQVLNALYTYRAGHGEGSSTWTPVGSVVDLLDDAFHQSFSTIIPAGKRTLVAVDVSASMRWPQSRPSGLPALTAADAAAAMAMATVRTEPDVIVTAFSDSFMPVPISARQRLDDVVATFDRIPMGGTDASLPMRWALQYGVEVETFVVYTDSQNWAGTQHPAQALRAYRDASGIPARLAVVAFAANSTSIADPRDPGQLDFVGFDASVPKVLADFSRGDV